MTAARPLNILMTVDPEIPVPPALYGGIERIVDMLVQGLTARGHTVRLAAHPSSTTPATLAPYPGRRSRPLGDTLRNAAHLRRLIKADRSIDLIHSFGRLAYLLGLLRSGVPMIQSYQRQITARSVWWGSHLAGDRLTFTSCSEYCAGQVRRSGGRWTVIPNGVPLASYPFAARVPVEAPLVFLGRLDRVKGAHAAIAIARRAGRALILAGNIADDTYYQQEIRPHCDGRRIAYIGPVDDREKQRLLSRAAALLFPVEWDEPFGIVLVEALACGTPVLAFRRGAVPEVIDHGVTGWLGDTVEELAEAVGRIDHWARAQCRRAVETRFSDQVIVDAYERLYRSSVEAAR